MRPQFSSFVALISTLALTTFTSAERLIESRSLNSCQDASNFTATLFNVVFTPGNNTLALDLIGVSSITGNITAQLEVIAYGFTVVNDTIDPCTENLPGLCPMSAGQISLPANIDVPASVQKEIPGITYSVPDLDAVVRIYIKDTSTGLNVACLEANLSNGETVDQAAVGWVTAVIAGLGLVAAGLTSGLGHTNTAAHVAANALSLFGYFQGQAVVGMTAVTMPPIVQSWTQNFQWSMGIVRVGFLQSICTWYQRATGGTPTTYLSTLATESVQVEKRSMEALADLTKRGAVYMADRASAYLAKRAASTTAANKVVIVRGIDRVGFRAGIEQTNIFLTSLIFFLVVCVIVAILIAMFKGFCEIAVRSEWMKSDKFLDFRNGWKIVLKGILFRLVLLGYVQISVLCLWELVERDSAAEVILALVVFISISAALGWASWKVIRLAKKSVVMHKNPAYILYSDPSCLNKWGFLYVQYRATAYYFIIPFLGYILFKSCFVAFAQAAPVAQALGLVIVEAVALISISVLRPFMDKKTNVFNICIAAVNFLNAIFLLIFSDVFSQPAYISGILGVVYALYNVIFAAALLILVLIASIYAVTSKNPDVRYQPMRDDRGSFIKSQSALNTELDALGATARGDTKSPYGHQKSIEDDDSLSSDSLSRQQHDASNAPLPASNVNSAYASQDNHSPVESGAAMYPSEPTGRRGPSPYAQRPGMHNQYGSDNSGSYGRPATASPAPGSYNNGYGGNNNGYNRAATSHGYANPVDRQRETREGGFRQQNAASPSPWQRGAGYD